MDKPFPLVDGHADPELADNGREQAQRLAQRLAKVPIDALYVTSLCRTAQTAAPLAGAARADPAGGAGPAGGQPG